MNQETYIQLYKNAREALAKYQLLDTLECIQSACTQLDAPELNLEKENIASDYMMMLHFISTGGKDPQRDQMHRSFIQKTTSLLYKMHRTYLKKQGKNYIAECIARCENDPTHYQIEELQEKILRFTGDRKVVYESLDKLFTAYLAADCFTDSRRQACIHFMEALEPELICPLLSALMLCCMESPDNNRLKVIFYFTGHPAAPVSLRALTALVLIYRRFGQLIALDEPFHREVQQFCLQENVQTDLFNLQRQLYISIATEKASRMLNTEILPDMMKSGMGNLSFMGQNGRMDLNALMEGMSLPENSPVQDKLKQLMDMTQMGYDINYSLFATAARTSFFSVFSHWFLIFDGKHPALDSHRNNPAHQQLFKMLCQSEKLCNMDKYAMIPVMASLPAGMREQMFAGGEEEILEQNESNGIESKNRQIVIRHIMQDLYRFYHTNIQRNGLENPFKENSLFVDYPVLKTLIHLPSFLHQITDFLIQTKQYEAVVAPLEYLIREEPANARMLHALGMAYTKEGKWKKALLYEQQAELLDPDNCEILETIQQCCKMLEKHQMRIDYLEKLEKIRESVVWDKEIIWSCLQSGMYEQALNRSYKLEFMEVEIPYARRTIAYCALKLKKTEVAYKYYQKLKESGDAGWNDLKNMGLTAWFLGKPEEAMLCFRNFITSCGQSSESDKHHWTEIFDRDRDICRLYDMSDKDICLLKECIQAIGQQYG